MPGTIRDHLRILFVTLLQFIGRHCSYQRDLCSSGFGVFGRLPGEVLVAIGSNKGKRGTLCRLIRTGGRGSLACPGVPGLSA